MKRRDFLQLASATGLIIPYWGWIPGAYAQSAPYTGKYLVNIHAAGGLDCSSWADPRESQPTVNVYAQAGTPAGVAGNIRYAPMGDNARFFQAHFRQMRVLNGVNSETNSHGDGTRCHATGMLAMGHANISELFADTHGGKAPFKWLNQGSFAVSQGLVAPTAMPNANSLLATLQPNRNNATADFIKRGDLDKIFAARAARLAAMKASGTVAPGTQRVNDQFLGANESRAMLDQASQFLPATFDAGFQAAHIGLTCMQAGIACTMQLSVGSFDTHSNHAVGHAAALTRLTNTVSYIWDKAAELGIANRMFVRVFSEFSRTRLNNSMGKDHYGPGGCQIIMEENPAWGNSVMGASGPQHQSVRIDRNTGVIDPVNGLVMRPRHLHQAIRKYLGIQVTNPQFDLRVPANEEFNIFGPGINTGYPTA
jgi:uncharacterized protein (DUF1501 family)